MRSIRTLAVLAAVLGLAMVAGAAPFVASDNFNSYADGSYLHGQGGWFDSAGGNNYKFSAGNGAGGTQGVDKGTGSNQMIWESHAWDWGTLAVGDKVIARMDFQANGSGNFDDDRVGWVLGNGSGGQITGSSNSSYNFAIQLDNSAGGIETYFRNLTGGRVLQTTVLNWAALGTPTGSNWYREELRVEKLTSGNGPGGAQVDVSFWALDGSGNPVGSPVTASYGTVDTSALRGFTGTVYPMFKNYSATNGYADNAYFEITPEPATMGLLALGALAMIRRRRK